MASRQLEDLTVTAEAMRRRWFDLARLLAEEAKRGGPRATGVQGSLMVLGSGIMHTDLSIETEEQLLAADHVFYSVNDHVTKSWVNALRPDAYDLTMLYDERVDRHATYTRMAEALLHHVRQGRRVVAILYGHPGVFAAPAHRAIHIARKEGHVARMRPGISALDSLIADIGFDPALPGLLMYEATDMLLRKRRLDPTLHTVIWQVGLVGELGYSRGGYNNQGLDLLVDVLEQTYGSESLVTHYIGAQYAGVSPHIRQLPIKMLRAPDVARELGTLSTFYIAPTKRAQTVVDTARAFGADVPARSDNRKGDYTVYGPRERSALQTIADLAPGEKYEVIQPNAVLNLLTLMSCDVALRERFEREPAEFLASAICANLSEWEKRLLETRQHKAFVAAIQGVAGPTVTNPSGYAS